jgi:hypothetical protein
MAKAQMKQATTPLQELDTRIKELNQRRDALTAAILKSEGPGINSFTRYDPATVAERKAAAGLLNGAFAKRKIAEDVPDVHAERKLINVALRMADEERTRLIALEDLERVKQTEGEWKDANRQVALAIIGLEKALLNRDAVWNKRRMRAFPAPHPNSEYRIERLSTRSGHGFMFLRTALENGWLSENEYSEILSETSQLNLPK